MAIKNKMRVDRIREFKRLIPLRCISYSGNGNVNVDLTANLVGLVIDGVTLAAGDYVGLFSQTTSSQSGIYEVVAGAGNSVRRYDLTVGEDASSCDFMASEGTVAANSLFCITNTKGSGVVGTDSLVVTPMTGSAATNVRNGLQVVGGFIELGGSLTRNTSVGGSTDNFYFGIDNGTSGTYRNSLYMRSGGLGFSLHSWDYVNDTDMQVQLNEINGVQLRMTDTSTSEQVGLRLLPNVTDYISIDHTDALFKGMMYSSDISANFENESLITKRYADNLVNGRSWKSPVVAIVDGANVTGNVDLSTNLVGTVIDGVTLAAGDRVGLFDQTTGSENGVYEVVSGAGNSVRASGWETGEEARNYTFFSSEGTLNADITWTITNNEGSDVIGTDTLITAQSGSATQITAGAGMVRNGSAFDVVAADASLTINADDMQVNIGTTNGASLEVSATGLELTPTITGARRFEDATSFGVAATGFTFPVLDGTAGQALITDGSGAVSWSDVTSKVVREDEDVFTGNGTITDFTMTNLGTHATVKVRHVVVFLGTSKLYGTDTVDVNNDYSYNPLTGVVTFTTAPANGENVQIHHYSQNA